ncbi:MAG: ATP-binding protein [Clostridiales bacterium]|nr:ATP-binding protein [Clostridiales bacterium]
MKTLTVQSTLSELEKIRSFLRAYLEGWDISEEDFFRIELALVEMCTNIVRYGYPGGNGDIQVKAWHEDERFYLEIRDSGVPFDPSRIRKPNLKNLANQERMGGLGIFLARKLMDGFAYRRENNQNILTMYKKVRPPAN